MPAKSYKLVGYIFDVIAAIVSLLDLSTDIIIMITWWYQQRMIFFYISLSILMLAQISYITVFYYNHGESFGGFKSISHSIISLLFTIPFAPFLSFIFYIVSDKDSKLRDFIDKYLICYNFHWGIHHVDQDASPQAQWLDEKLYKHLGFLLEALIEAFPQSILQLTAIVYYNEPNTISIISILISMISVCSKLLLLLLTGEFKGWKLKLWLWLCFVVDFFGIFFIVSFSFYNQTNADLQIYFVTIRDICVYEFIICIAPFATIGAIGINLYWTVDYSTDNHPLSCFCWTILFTLLMVLGLFVVFLMMQIFCCWWVGMAVIWLCTSERLPYIRMHKTFYWEFIDWLLYEIDNDDNIGGVKSYHIGSRSKHQDIVLKLCVFNKFVMENSKRIDGRTKWDNVYNDKFMTYLLNEQKTQFRNVRLNEMRIQCTNDAFKPGVVHNERHSCIIYSFYYEVWGSMFTEYMREMDNAYSNVYRFTAGIGVVTLFFLTFITGPIYVLSRFCNLLLPIFVLLYLYIQADINLFVDINAFQVIMWSVYVFMLTVWFILLCFVLRDEYYLWHMLPNSNYIKGGNNCMEVSTQIKNCYFEIKIYPIIEKILYDYYGSDIGHVVLEYYDAIKIDDSLDTDSEALPIEQTHDLSSLL